MINIATLGFFKKEPFFTQFYYGTIVALKLVGG
jgi:hypothetical protein